MDEAERYADPIDAGSARAEQWLADKLAEAQYQLGHAVSAFEIGRCRNCNDKTDDSRAYCTTECRDDHQARMRMEKRRGR